MFLKKSYILLSGSSPPPLLKTVGELKSYIETFNADIDDADCRLLCGTIRKGLVVFLHSANKSAQFTTTARPLTEITKNSGLIFDNVDMDSVKSAIAFLIKSVEKKKKKNQA